MRFWNNLGLTWKMSIFVVSMLLVIGVLSGRFFLTIGHLSDEARDVKDQGAIGALMLAREIDHLNWIGALQRYVLDPKQTTLQLQADPHKCGLGQWYYGAGRKDAVTKFPQLEAELAKLEASHTALHESAVQVRQLKEKGDGAGALRVFNEVSTPSVQTVQAGLKKVTAMMDQAQAATIQEFEYNVAASQKLAIAGNVIGVVLALLMGILIAKTVASPMEKLAKAATLIANGDLNVDIAMKRTDEIGSLASAMQRVSAVLQSILGEYQTLEKRVEGGDLDAKADAAAYQGGFATLISGTNAILGRFLYILEHLPTPVVLLCKDLKISYLNAVGRDVSGAGFMGKTCKQVMARDDSDTPDDALQKAVTTLRPATGETRAHPQGKDLDIRYTVIPILTQEGKLACVLQLITDLTAIKQTQRTIANVADQAATIANRVAAASEELSAQVAQVTAGTELERDRMDSTASAMTEMNATVLEVARSAGQASEQSEATRSKASDGAELVDRVVRSINLVNKVAATLQTNMQELGSQAESIGGVMNVISDIADQTNLLALNAAIEAARAGEAGRGFAVVADEVRKLAEKTMSATQEVGANISAIQQSARTNIGEVSEAVKAVTEATDLANTSGQALEEIVSLASANSAVVTSIATAAEEQSATSEEINRAIEAVSLIVRDTADGMAQASAAVQELSRMAQELNTVMTELR